MKSAYITGASRGLGLRVSELLSEDYALGLGCHQTPAPELPNSVVLRGDVGLAETADRAIRSILERFGRLDLFIANAGIVIDKPFLSMDENSWDEVIRTNLTGVFYGLRSCAPALIESHGSVVITSSLLGRRGSFGSANYAASKAGLIGLARTAARELAPHVRVNVVIPGYMETDMGVSSPAALDAARSEHPLGCLTEIDDAARLIIDVAHLKTVTGQIFTADGRMAAW